MVTLNCGSTFTNAILAAHNKYRALHQNTPSLSTNSQITAVAQAYSNHLAKNMVFVHSKNGYGENLYYSGSTKLESCDGK